MRVYLDCEFNGFGGDLISMGMVSEDNTEFYELVNYPVDGAHPWVKENVLPVIGDDLMPISMGEFRARLQKYLNRWHEVEIIADWPQDLKHFFESLYMQDDMLMLPRVKATLVRGLRTHSENPHNALADARALRIAHMKG